MSNTFSSRKSNILFCLFNNIDLAIEIRLRKKWEQIPAKHFALQYV